MSFFKRLIDKKDIKEHKGFKDRSEDIEEEDLEKLYLRLYMKIARDFVTREDYQRNLEELLSHIDLTPEDINIYGTGEALSLGYDYKDILEGNSANNYKDLIDLDE